MSIPVELNSLAEVMMQYPFAYLLTTRAGAAPHAVAVTAVMDGGELVVAATGQRTRANAPLAPAVSLVWPPSSPQAYSLIIDGLASVTGESIRIAPSRAVLHRPAPSPRPTPAGGCVSDCLPLTLDVGVAKSSMALS